MSFDLGTADTYAMLGWAGITFNSASSVTNGNLCAGLGSSSITGIYTLNGTAVVDNGGAGQAQTDVNTAIGQIILQPDTQSFTGTGPYDLSTLIGTTITGPGKYSFDDILNIPTDITLPGTGTGYYIFLATQIVMNGSVLVAPGGVDPTKVLFISSSDITANTASKIYNGTYIAYTAVSMGTVSNTTIIGRLIAQNESITFAGTNILPLPVCFAKGTKIMTTRGFLPIEDITLKDNVITSGIIEKGVVSPIELVKTPVIFIGKYLQDNLSRLTRPIIISKNSLGNNVPMEDVRVSPNHAIVVNNKTVFAKDLINNNTIYQDMKCESVEYYHIMTQNHCTLNASGLWSESLKGCTEKFTEFMSSESMSKYIKPSNNIKNKTYSVSK